MNLEDKKLILEILCYTLLLSIFLIGIGISFIENYDFNDCTHCKSTDMNSSTTPLCHLSCKTPLIFVMITAAIIMILIHCSTPSITKK